jgi:hypothetical protein
MSTSSSLDKGEGIYDNVLSHLFETTVSKILLVLEKQKHENSLTIYNNKK